MKNFLHRRFSYFLIFLGWTLAAALIINFLILGYYILNPPPPPFHLKFDNGLVYVNGEIRGIHLWRCFPYMIVVAAGAAFLFARTSFPSDSKN
ncbi:MAG: hypothetical protein GXO27_00200 [Chlorobi bacterium]|nr:hypothetical protein [Chlorobiota bacterium]